MTGQIAKPAATVRRSRAIFRGLVHLFCLTPLLWLLFLAGNGGLGANPIEAVIRDLGDWALRFLVVTVTVTPFRRLAGWPAIAAYRRMLGLWAFAYAVLHLLGYVVLDQFFDWPNIGHEILKHKFITAGMTAFVLLIPLAATSTTAMIRRLGGRRWRNLHRLVYPASLLAAVHYVWMVKADIRQPLLYGVVVLAGLVYRVGAAWRNRRREGNGAMHKINKLV